MKVIGFKYVSFDSIDARGYDIPESLKAKGYSVKYGKDGKPRWYVRQCKVLLTVINDYGNEGTYNIYSDIMMLFPHRKRMSLELAHDVYFGIVRTKEFCFSIHGGTPHLWRRKK